MPRSATWSGPWVKLGVAAYQNAVLRRELEERGEAVERELELQRAALTAISEQMLADKDLQIQVEDRNPLFADYLGEGTLPSNWSERRITAFRRTAEFESLNAAAKAAGNLHESWIAFVENRLDASSLLLLIRDIEELVQLAEKIRARR